MRIRPNGEANNLHQMQDYGVQALGRISPLRLQACYVDSKGVLGVLGGSVELLLAVPEENASSSVLYEEVIA